MLPCLPLLEKASSKFLYVKDFKILIHAIGGAPNSSPIFFFAKLSYHLLSLVSSIVFLLSTMAPIWTHSRPLGPIAKPIQVLGLLFGSLSSSLVWAMDLIALDLGETSPFRINSNFDRFNPMAERTSMSLIHCHSVMYPILDFVT